MWPTRETLSRGGAVGSWVAGDGTTGSWVAGAGAVEACVIAGAVEGARMSSYLYEPCDPIVRDRMWSIYVLMSWSGIPVIIDNAWYESKRSDAK